MKTLILSAAFVLTASASAVASEGVASTSAIETSRILDSSGAFWLALVFGVMYGIAVVVVSICYFRFAGKSLEKDNRSAIRGTGAMFIKSITISLIIDTVLLLTILERLSGTEAATILSGIAGYVLGSIRSERSQHVQAGGTGVGTTTPPNVAATP